MSINIDLYDPIGFEAVVNHDDPKDEEGKRIVITDNGDQTKLWLKPWQAQALRQALDALYPTASDAVVEKARLGEPFIVEPERDAAATLPTLPTCLASIQRRSTDKITRHFDVDGNEVDTFGIA